MHDDHDIRSESNGTAMENGNKDETHSVSKSDKQKDESNIASVVNQTNFLSKIPLLNKLFKGSTKKKNHGLKLFEIHKFADKFDIFLMVIGSIAALATAASNILLYYLARQVFDNLIHIDSNSLNTMNTSQCLDTILLNSNNSRSPFDATQLITKYYVLIGCISMFFYWLAWSTWMIAAERQIRCIRYKIFRNILRQEISWFDMHSTGELSNRLINDLDKLKNGINEKVPDFIALLSRTIGTIIYALIIGWKLTLIFLSISPFVVIVYKITIAMMVKYSVKEIQAYDKALSIAQEVIENIRTVTSFHGQKKEEERYGDNLQSGKIIGIRKGLFMGICQGLGQLLNFAAFAVTFWYGPHLVRTECENYSPGTLLIVFISCMTSTYSATQFIPIFRNFAEASASGRCIFDIIEQKSKIDVTNEDGKKPEMIQGDIEFENVAFAYPTRQKSLILNNISMKIPSGKTVAVVGASGCGKSTIIQLIQRLYDVDNGQILIDGHDIKTLNIAWLRSNIGIVSQEPVLFTGTIEDNIRLGKLDATDEEVITAAKMANAHNFIMTFPENYKTLPNNKLSGGEKQRIAIARALIKNPKILLLDEATSALDYTSERIVQDALDNAKEGRTTIIVAHRLSTIRNVDLIIGLENGEIKEYGTHEELMEKEGLYYGLVTAQDENKETEVLDDRETRVTRSFSRSLSGEFKELNDEMDDIEVASNDSPEETEKKRFYAFIELRMLKFNKAEWYWILIGAIASIIFGAIQPSFAYLYSRVYGLFAEKDEEKQKHQMQLYAIGIFLVGVLGAFSQFILNYSFAKSGEELTVRIRKLVFSSILRQEMSYFDMKQNSTEALITRLASDASAIKRLTGLRIGIILQGLSALFVSLIICFISGWKLTLVITCFMPLIFLSSRLRGKRQGNIGKTKDKYLSSELGKQCANEAMRNIRTVVALHQEDYFINIYEQAFNQEFKKNMCRLHVVAFSSGLANSLKFFIYAVNFAYGIVLARNGEMTFENVYKISAVIIIAIQTVGQSTGETSDYFKAKSAAIKILKLINYQSSIDPQDESGITLENVQGNIEFKNVSYQYSTRSHFPILKNFSLTCVKDGTTALVGPSGSGKSTAISLLQRFYDPIEGQILLDGHDISTLNLRWFRSLMGLVQQEPVLFNLSIRDNIAYGDNSRQVTQQEIEEAAQKANIHDLIISLPQGYDTICGTKGNQLSAGQKQRIAIARVLIRMPKIFLFDEATSALDNKSEIAVQEALDSSSSGRTCLTIAHRLSTIRNSEKIAVVDKGKIREEGTHNDLLKLNGIYLKMILTQDRSLVFH